jgi:tRNA pseudouridine38-40 synthase
MPRYKLTLEYDGAPFVGWQRQANGLSVQEAVERALESLTGERAAVRGAGRTDSGVHALGQVAHADLAKAWMPSVLRDGLNAHLRPHPVAILSAKIVPGSFDARFSALRRHYLYRIINRRAPLTVAQGRAWLVGRPLDIGAMRRAASHLVGRYDFSTFRAAECQAASPIRTLDRLDIEEEAGEIRFLASARSFLHTQVRSMVGSLVHAGTGKWSERDFIAARDARDRRCCGVIAPPQGLYLIRVDYDAAAEEAPGAAEDLEPAPVAPLSLCAGGR